MFCSQDSKIKSTCDGKLIYNAVILDTPHRWKTLFRQHHGVEMILLSTIQSWWEDEWIVENLVEAAKH